MAKLKIKATAMGMPMSCVVVTSYEPKRGGNMITLAYCAPVNADPPLIAISVRPSRYSYALIKNEREFAVNVPFAEQAREVDLAGVISGKNVDKFDLLKLTRADASIIKAPLIKEFPINIECKVMDCLELPTHHLFIGEVLAVHADEAIVTEGNVLASDAIPLMMFWNHNYFSIGEKLGDFGFSKR
ncbi:flavin reductase family protein [bacterium]|nr:flavin reductase family protein [bacterium]